MAARGGNHAADTAAGALATGTSDELAPQLEAVLRRCVAMVQASPDRWPELTELLLPYAPVLRVQRRDSDGDAAAGSPVHARQRARPAASALTPARMDSDIDVLVEQLRVGASHDDDGTLDRALADGARRAASQPGTGGSGDASADESGGKEEGKGECAGKEADAVVVGEELLRSDSAGDSDGNGEDVAYARAGDEGSARDPAAPSQGDSAHAHAPPLDSRPSVVAEAETLLAELELDPDTAGGT